MDPRLKGTGEFERWRLLGAAVGQIVGGLWSLWPGQKPAPPALNLTQRIVRDPASVASKYAQLHLRFSEKAQRLGEARREKRMLRGKLADAEKLVEDLRGQNAALRKTVLAVRAHELSADDAAALDGLKTTLGNGVATTVGGEP